MTRAEAELALLREGWPALAWHEDGQWVCLPSHPLPKGWSQDKVDVAFQIPPGDPTQAPYAFYANANLSFDGQQPQNYTPEASAALPWAGSWSVFSWAPETWAPAADVRTGANMRSFVRSFTDRFEDGA